MKEVFLTDGTVALVDDADYELVSRYSWYPHKPESNGDIYARTFIEGKRVYMHRLILGITKDEGDHINHSTLDNRRSNLRRVDRGANARNTRGWKSGTSRYKGVSWDKARCKWAALIYPNRKHVFLGRFDEEIDAARAYNQAAIQYFGSFAYLNPV
jgi:hypothetical protein